MEAEDAMNMNSFEPTPKRQKMHLDVGTAEGEGISTDEFAIIFSFLSRQDIMRARVCRAWRQAAKEAIVPMSQFVVDSNSLQSYNTMRAMSTALPSSMQWIKLTFEPFHPSDSDSDSDFDEAPADYDEPVNYLVDAITILPNFTKLRSLEIKSCSWSWSSYSCPLSGRYPVLSNFSLLQKLKISCGWHLDLEMLSALPLLKELELSVNLTLTGNLSSLRSLKETLEKINICSIEGNFMDLADFSRLKELDLGYGVTGDIRDIRVKDFPALEVLRLPRTVHGGTDYEFQRISDVPSFMQAIHFLLQRTPTLLKDYHIDSHDWIMDAGLRWSLSKDSPDWYDWDYYSGKPYPPFDLQLICKGSRLGWIWYGNINRDLLDYSDQDKLDQSCEINWLDPESKQNENVERFDETCIFWSLGQGVEIDFFSGYHEPPNELEYLRLCEG